MIGLVATALALEGWVSAGPSLVVNDPLQRTTSLDLGVGVWALPWLGAEASVGYAPGFARAKGPLSATLLTGGIEPVYSWMVTDPRVTAVVRPIRVQGEGVSAALALRAGGGAVRTEDLPDLGYDSQPAFEVTRYQWHPLVEVGVWAEAGVGRWSFRVGLDRAEYQEVIYGEVEERKTPLWLRSAVSWRWGAPS